MDTHEEVSSIELRQLFWAELLSNFNFWSTEKETQNDPLRHHLTLDKSIHSVHSDVALGPGWPAFDNCD